MVSDKTAEYQERINKHVFTLTEAKVFIDDFNSQIVMYGSCKVPEVLVWTESDFCRNVKYADYMYGWTEQISLEKNFTIKVKGNDVSFIPNLPEPVSFYE